MFVFLPWWCEETAARDWSAITATCGMVTAAPVWVMSAVTSRLFCSSCSNSPAGSTEALSHVIQPLNLTVCEDFKLHCETVNGLKTFHKLPHLLGLMSFQTTKWYHLRINQWQTLLAPCCFCSMCCVRFVFCSDTEFAAVWKTSLFKHTRSWLKTFYLERYVWVVPHHLMTSQDRHDKLQQAAIK